MSNEASKTSVVLKEVHAAFPLAFIYKISDRLTAGIPDALIVVAGVSIFVEFKVLKKGQQIGTVVRPVQKQQLRRIALAGGLAIVCAFTPDGERLFSDDLHPLVYPTLMDFVKAQVNR